jgi:arylsulfatase A-like enzyme
MTARRAAPERPRAARRRKLLAVVLALLLISGVAAALYRRSEPGNVPSFQAQACALPAGYLQTIKDGYKPGRSGQIQVVPHQPAYFASGAGGWSHSGPWPYLQDVPLLFYGPGIVPGAQSVARRVTLADVAPTIATMLGTALPPETGNSLPEVALRGSTAPALVVTIVWDGGGWNTLRRWPDSWPVLKRMMSESVLYTNAIVGSNPSVTPSIHTTLGTGTFPARHGITDIPVIDEDGKIVDAFYGGESSRLMDVPALAELWDEEHENSALIGMIGYEPWHLGMIGQGAERAGGDKDDAVWLDTETNEWITNPSHYRMPPSIASTQPRLNDFVRELDAVDGEIDNAWGEHAILDDPERMEETPAFIAYHGAVMRNLIDAEGYGDDGIADLLFTNFKQIDRVGHYFNMASEEVRDSITATDQELGRLIDWLDREVGRGEYVVVVTADHGQQPDDSDIGGYGINPKEIIADVEREFGRIVFNLRPTQMFLDEDAMRERGVTLDEVARWLADYRLEDNTGDPRILIAGAGEFDRDDRLFDLVAPSEVLADMTCQAR